MRRSGVLLVGIVVMALAGCGGGAKVTPTPGSSALVTPTQASSSIGSPSATVGSTAAAGLHVVLNGSDLCDHLTAADFSAAGVDGAGLVSENNTATEFFCVYAGNSSATGGIELDAFVYDNADDADAGYDSLVPTDGQDVTAQVPNAQAAVVGTTTSGGPEFAIIAVRSGNLVYGIGVPETGSWQAALVALAGQFMSRAQPLSSAAP